MGEVPGYYHGVHRIALFNDAVQPEKFTMDVREGKIFHNDLCFARMINKCCYGQLLRAEATIKRITVITPPTDVIL